MARLDAHIVLLVALHCIAATGAPREGPPRDVVIGRDLREAQAILDRWSPAKRGAALQAGAIGARGAENFVPAACDARGVVVGARVGSWRLSRMPRGVSVESGLALGTSRAVPAGSSRVTG